MNIKKTFRRLNPVSETADARQARITDEFVKAFFGGDEALERYRDEFNESRIPDICRDAKRSLPEEFAMYDIHNEECKRYYALVRELKPEVVVESGVHSGVSTLGLLCALERNGAGKLYSISSPVSEPHRRRTGASCAETGSEELPPDKEPGWLVPGDLHAYWDPRDGKIPVELPRLLEQVGGIDIYLHDSDISTTGTLFELELAWEWLRPDGVILSHHAGCNDAFETFARERDAEVGLVFWRPPKHGENMVEPRECKYIRKPIET